MYRNHRILIFGVCAVFLLGCVEKSHSVDSVGGSSTGLNKEDIYIDDIQADSIDQEGSAGIGRDFPEDDEQSSGVRPPIDDDEGDDIDGSGEGSGGGPVPVVGSDPARPLPTPVSPSTTTTTTATTTTTTVTLTTTTAATTEPPTSTMGNIIPELPITKTPPPSPSEYPPGTDDGNTEGNTITGMGRRTNEKSTSFLSQPGILAAVIGGAVVGLLCAILLVMFIVYRMRKKDEGSYALDEPKRSPRNTCSYQPPNKEFYA